MKKTFFVLLAAATIMMVSCKKENQPEDNNGGKTAYVLSEGSWGGNNASISLINEEGMHNDWFANANGRALGDLAQDLIHYGSKLYCTVNESNTVEVIDPTTGKSVKQIDFGKRGPRYMAAVNGKVYVTCYDKTVVRIDTTSLAIEATCALSGKQPEQLCVLGNNLYVCNCWENDSEGNATYDNTISVVDLTSFTETSKITVGTNPGKIKAIDDHRIIVACAGDYYTVPAETRIVDVANLSQNTLSVAATNFDVLDNEIFLYATAYDANWNTTVEFYRVNTTTLEAVPFLQNYASSLSNTYGLNINPVTKQLYICNSAYNVNGDVYIFNLDGTEDGHYEAGIYASKVVF
ncbi:MAG: hypothetical protein MJZ67_08605 [Bacteroidales bacterium]|nr:hypothetical protein [Bacteroidales bacterium]